MPFGYTEPDANVDQENVATRLTAVANSKGGRPPIGSYIFFQKAAFLRVKGIYFVVRIFDE